MNDLIDLLDEPLDRRAAPVAAMRVLFRARLQQRASTKCAPCATKPQCHCADATGIFVTLTRLFSTLKIKHNNVLGYFRPRSQRLMPKDAVGAADGYFYPPSNTANQVRFTTVELLKLEDQDSLTRANHALEIEKAASMKRLKRAHSGTTQAPSCGHRPDWQKIDLAAGGRACTSLRTG